MADCIKTAIMKAIGTLLTNITDLQSIKRWRGKPIDYDLVPLPALFFYDESEARERNNLNQHGLIDLYLIVVFNLPLDDVDVSGAQEFSDQADDIQAQIHNLFFGTTNLRSLGVIKLTEENFNKEYPNDTIGLLIQKYTLTYAHKFGDAFNTYL